VIDGFSRTEHQQFLGLPLRILLPTLQSPWTTPLLSEPPARIQAAIDFLWSKGFEQISLVEHSLGASMGAYYLSGLGNPAIHAFAGIGMRANLGSR
jgi:hypothetical protein